MQVYVDQRTEDLLRRAAEATGQAPEALAALAVENYMADWERRNRPSFGVRKDISGDYDGSIPERRPPPEWG